MQQADLSGVVAHTPTYTDISYERSSDCAPKREYDIWERMIQYVYGFIRNALKRHGTSQPQARRDIWSCFRLCTSRPGPWTCLGVGGVDGGIWGPMCGHWLVWRQPCATVLYTRAHGRLRPYAARQQVLIEHGQVPRCSLWEASRLTLQPSEQADRMKRSFGPWWTRCYSNLPYCTVVATASRHADRQEVRAARHNNRSGSLLRPSVSITILAGAIGRCSSTL
jgi:hypothetical protein